MSEPFIEVPIETEPDALAADGFDYVQSKFPGWLPNDGNLDTIVIEAAAFMASQARDVASAVPTEIFRYFGKLVNILPDDATFATATTTWTVVDNAGYVIPAGTQVGIEQSGDNIIPFETQVDVVIPVGSTSVTGVVIQAIEAGEAGSGLENTLTVVLLDTLDYVDSIDLTSDTVGGHDAEDDDDYLQRLAGRLQVMTQHPVLPADFAIFAQDIDGVARAVAIDGLNPDFNMLTANQSSVETDTTGLVAITNCTIARDTAQFADGAASLRMRSSAGGAMVAGTTPTNQYAIVGLQKITGIAQFRTAVSGRSCRVNLMWYDSGNAFISTTNGASVTDTTSGWTQAFCTATAPANAAFVRIAFEVLGTGAANEDHYVDKIGLKKSSSINWFVGGGSEFGNDKYITLALMDEAGQPVDFTVKSNVDSYLESLREVNFVVEIIDPHYTDIDVQFTAVARSGFTISDVEAAAEAAVADYLSPANWGLPTVAGDRIVPMWNNQTVIRLYEIATVINEVSGIDYIVAGTLQTRVAGGSFGTTDIVIGGYFPVPTPNNITATITAP